MLNTTVDNVGARHAAFATWFVELERLPAYAGLASDFFTHAHDLPPQMGACYPSNSPSQRANASRMPKMFPLFKQSKIIRRLNC